jgi:protein-ribulosamine 3-kinase
MRRMHQIMLDKVIPRLLRPLETGGHQIKPRIVHGDMWDGNTSVDANTDLAVIFDASGSYAHNECMSPRANL